MAYLHSVTASLEISKGSQRREEILAVARKRLIEEGYNHFVLREIAAQCGMTIGNLQYYFRTRERLLEEVTRTALFDDLKTLEEASQSVPQGKAQLRELASVILRKWLGEHDKIYAAASFLSRSEPAFRSLLSELYRQFFDQLIVVLRKLRPRLHRQTLLDKARLITAVLDGAVIQLRTGAVPTTSGARARFVENVCAQVVAIGSE
jgi:AcrR family transcriptional regulator